MRQREHDPGHPACHSLGLAGVLLGHARSGEPRVERDRHHPEDISDVKRARDEAESARRQLERANEAIRTFVEEAPDGVFVVNPSGRYTDVNRAGAYGARLHAGQDRRQGDRGPPSCRGGPAVRASYRQRLLAGGSASSTGSCCAKAAPFIPFEVSASDPLRRSLPGLRPGDHEFASNWKRPSRPSKTTWCSRNRWPRWEAGGWTSGARSSAGPRRPTGSTPSRRCPDLRGVHGLHSSR